MEIKIDVKADLSKPLLLLTEIKTDAIGTIYQDTGLDVVIAS